MRDVVGAGAVSPTPRTPTFKATETSAAVADGRAGSVEPGALRRPMFAAGPASPGKSFGRHVVAAVLLVGAAIGIGMAGSPTASAACTAPGPPAAMVQVDSAAPKAPAPVQAAPATDEMTAWINNVTTANTAIKQGNANAFLAVTSPSGLDVRGLDQKDPLAVQHFSMDQLKQDVSSKGPFYSTVFVTHAIGHGVMSPDAQGNVASLFLN